MSKENMSPAWWEAVITRGPFNPRGLTLIPGWINNYLPIKAWGEITYPSSNFNGTLQWCNRPRLGMIKLFHPTLYTGCSYLFTLGSKLIHVCKLGVFASHLKKSDNQNALLNSIVVTWRNLFVWQVQRRCKAATALQAGRMGKPHLQSSS